MKVKSRAEKLKFFLLLLYWKITKLIIISALKQDFSKLLKSTASTGMTRIPWDWKPKV